MHDARGHAQVSNGRVVSKRFRIFSLAMMRHEEKTSGSTAGRPTLELLHASFYVLSHLTTLHGLQSLHRASSRLTTI